MKDHNYTIFFCMGPDQYHGQDFGVYQNTDQRIAIIHYMDNPGVVIPSITLNIWHHLALVYDGTYEYIFLDGKTVFKNQRTINTPGGYLSLNTQGEDADSYSQISYDEFRVSSIARWTEDFIPPKYPYSRNLNLYLDKNNYLYGVI